MCGHGDVHRVAREGDCDAGAELQSFSPVSGEHKGQERVAVRLGRTSSIETECFKLFCLHGDWCGSDLPRRIEPRLDLK